ncbi:phospholipid carrier-dependent glycosyltransferase [Actinospica durhamensis]|uniref:Phospholipid carrier-dependent glycosyltransferase n=1 Tax=Actinospica durhamensis TaxID=1508375 RepID=A0A941EKI5_9ACTN|nr:phospholipid carrier-dependent glycosyltransferase [Actinospica durhamensis]MBR7832540.1 phospholipid carrier-dependent glycosyltransferase [Actinospica durhamensis]
MGIWAVFQNFYHIGVAPILNDEPTYTVAARRYLSGQILAPLPVTPQANGVMQFNDDNFEHPPLTKYLFGMAEWFDSSSTGVTAARAVSAAAALLGAVAIAIWIGRHAGRWTGLVAGGLLTLLPEAAGGSIGRFDRFAMLDTTAGMFMVLSVVLAWIWSRRTGRAGWVAAGLTGLAIGCASASKENGFLGVIGPVLLVLGAPLVGRDVRAFLVRCGQTVAAAVIALATFLACYLPFSHPIARLHYLVAFQTNQSAGGHLIGFDGRVTAHPPWWTNLWFAGHAYGSILTVFLVVAALCAVVLRRDGLVAWCVAALAVPILFHCFIAHVALGYYYVMWTPFFLALAALGVGEVARRVVGLSRGGVRVLVAAVVGIAVLAVPVGESVAETVNVADLKPTGVMVVPELMRADGLSAAVVTAGLPAWEWHYYMPTTTVYYSAKTPVPDAAIIVVGQPICRVLIDQSVRALVAVNLESGAVKEIYSDSLIVAYAVTGKLTVPTPAQINAEPPGALTDHC